MAAVLQASACEDRNHPCAHPIARPCRQSRQSRQRPSGPLASLSMAHISPHNCEPRRVSSPSPLGFSRRNSRRKGVAGRFERDERSQHCRRPRSLCSHYYIIILHRDFRRWFVPRERGAMCSHVRLQFCPLVMRLPRSAMSSDPSPFTQAARALRLLLNIYAYIATKAR